jgi:hypothetical protein
MPAILETDDQVQVIKSLQNHNSFHFETLSEILLTLSKPGLVECFNDNRSEGTDKHFEASEQLDVVHR